MRSSRLFGLLTLAAAIGGIGNPVAAQAHVSYAAVQECPAQQRFELAVEARGARLNEPTSKPRELRVSIVKQGDAYRGSLQLGGGDEGASGAREVHGATCDEVVDALAVVSAIALREESNPTGEAPVTPPPTEAVTAPAPPAPPKPETPPTPRLQATERFGSNFDGHREIAVEAGTLSFDRTLVVGLSAGGALGIVPGKVMPRYALSIVRGSFVTPPDRPSVLIGPIVRGHVNFFGPTSHQTHDHSTQVFGMSTALGMCWAPTYDSRGLIALLCSELGFGVMQLNTDDRAGKQVQSKSSAFGSVGVGFETQYNLGPLVQLGLKLGVDLTTQPFSAEGADGQRLFRSASFGASSSFSGYGISGYGLLSVGFNL
jgi:hypothetical protein